MRASPTKCRDHRGHKLCFKSRDEGGCPFGDNCEFDHPEEAKGKGADYVDEEQIESRKRYPCSLISLRVGNANKEEDVPSFMRRKMNNRNRPEYK